MTEKLYYEDSHMRDFIARVISCEWEEKQACFQVILDRTAFFPEGGGQYADTGVLDGVPVADVQERDGQIVHYLRGPLEAGSQVEGSIDYPQRFSRMQQHSGEHIVSGLVHRHFGYDNVGFHLGNELVTMDFDGILTAEQLRLVEAEANGAVAADIPIEVIYPTGEELDTLDYRSKKELTGQVRIVIVPGYDVCACCAPHVARTGEIGLIKLTDAIKYKGGTRVTMVCGDRALQDYQRKEDNVREISHLLSAKPDEVAEAVKRLQGELRQCREKLTRAQNAWVEQKLNEIDANAMQVVLFEEDLDRNAARRFVDAGMHKCSGICAVFLGNDSTGYQYTIGSQSVDLREFLKTFHGTFVGKGGGKGAMVQGTAAGTRAQLQSFFQICAGRRKA